MRSGIATITEPASKYMDLFLKPFTTSLIDVEAETNIDCDEGPGGLHHFFFQIQGSL